MDDEDESREDGSHNPERNFAKRVLGLIAAEELVDGVDPLSDEIERPKLEEARDEEGGESAGDAPPVGTDKRPETKQVLQDPTSAGSRAASIRAGPGRSVTAGKAEILDVEIKRNREVAETTTVYTRRDPRHEIRRKSRSRRVIGQTPTQGSRRHDP